MSKNADPPSPLAESLAALRLSDAAGRAMLTAALLRETDPELWREFCRRHPEGGRLDGADALAAAAGEADFSVREQAEGPLAQMLPADPFTRQISRELQLLARTGGELSLLCAAVCGPEAESDGSLLGAALAEALAESLHACQESCDSLGCTGPGRFALLLPGVGRLRARLLAEQVRQHFAARTANLLRRAEDGPLPLCAVGVVCAAQGRRPPARILIQQADAALHAAQASTEGISLAEDPRERDSLVQAHEKRFLFFGS